MIDLRTTKEVKRAANDRKAAELFEQIKREHPGAADTRIIAAMVRENTTQYKSLAGLRSALIRTKSITVKPRYGSDRA